MCIRDSPEDIQLLADEAPSAAMRDAALALADECLQRRQHDKLPDKVFLFAGHMIYTPDRLPPRFTPDKGDIVAAGNGSARDETDAVPGDFAIAPGAGGSGHRPCQAVRRSQAGRTGSR